MENVDWNLKVEEALDRTEFMAISTVGPEGSWTNPVAFTYNEKADLFFISMMDALHVKNILANSQISGAIFKTERFAEGDVLGLQIKGECVHLTDKEEIVEAASYYFGRRASNDEFRIKTSEKSGEDALWQFFKITLTELWCFDSRVFGEKRERVDLSLLSIAIL